MRTSIVNLLGLNEDLNFKKIIKVVIFYGLPFFLLLFFIILGFSDEGPQQFSLLSQGFLNGHLYFNHDIGGIGQDPVLYKGHVYWDEGPFPAIVLLPFVALFNIFHILFLQGYLKWLIVIGIIYFIYKLARNFNYDVKDSIFMTIMFCLGTVFIGVNSVSSSWLFAQVVNTFLLFAFLYEFFSKKRYFLLGSLAAAIFLTRMSALPIVILPIIDMLVRKNNFKSILRNTAILVIPLLISLVMALSYNYLRFGNALQNGNKYQLISDYSNDARKMGIISISHIPTNLYTLLLRGPDEILRDSVGWSLGFPYIQNNELGMSIFITSPFMLYFFFVKFKKYPFEAKLLLIPSAISAILVLLYYGDGGYQMGYRYSLDFLPELFVAFMLIYRTKNTKVTIAMKSLVLITILTNTYFVYGFLTY